MSVDLAHLTRKLSSIGSSSTSPQPRPTLPNSTLCNDISTALPRPPAPTPSYHSFAHRGAPSSPMTAQRMNTFTCATAVDANSSSLVQPTQTLCRRSSRVSRWLSDLQSPDIFDLANVDSIGTQCNPYLAYPHLSMAAVRRSLDDADSLHDYVIVDEEIALECPPDNPPNDPPSHNSAPTDIASPRSTIRLINPSQSLRHFHLSKRPISPSPRTTTSRNPSKLSMLHRSSRSDLTSGTSPLSSHSRSTSLQTSLPRNSSPISATPRRSSWRWRPSVLGHFSASSPNTNAGISPGDSLTDRSQPRPSMSSSVTCSSNTTPTTMFTYEDGGSPVPSTPPSQPSSLSGSLRVHSQAAGIMSQPSLKTDSSASSPSLRPLHPASVPHLPERPVASPSSPKSGAIRLSLSSKPRQTQSDGVRQIVIEEPDGSQPHVLFGGKPRLSLSYPTRQKKKLVVSGIPLNDTKRLDALQKWCQSFGEVDQITRMPNGELHINFQKAEVADTVCRVRAKVHIAGAGSVHLSWTTGNKRT